MNFLEAVHRRELQQTWKCKTAGGVHGEEHAAQDTELDRDLCRPVGEDVVDDEVGGFVGKEGLEGVVEEIEGVLVILCGEIGCGLGVFIEVIHVEEGELDEGDLDC